MTYPPIFGIKNIEWLDTQAAPKASLYLRSTPFANIQDKKGFNLYLKKLLELKEIFKKEDKTNIEFVELSKLEKEVKKYGEKFK